MKGAALDSPDSRSAERLPAATGLVAAMIGASCCLLPIALIATAVVGVALLLKLFPSWTASILQRL